MNFRLIMVNGNTERGMDGATIAMTMVPSILENTSTEKNTAMVFALFRTALCMMVNGKMA